MFIECGSVDFSRKSEMEYMDTNSELRRRNGAEAAES